MQVTLRELVVNAALVAKPPYKRFYEGRPHGARKFEALDRDRLLKPNMPAAIDHGKAALAHSRIHPELSVEHLPDEAKEVLRAHTEYDIDLSDHPFEIRPDVLKQKLRIGA
jgi:hypothetical protein